jgi:hypothetical protein
MGPVRQLWDGWARVARRIGDLQARLLLSVFYFVVLGPFALGVRLGSDPLRLRRGARPRWGERTRLSGDPRALARRQF